MSAISAAATSVGNIVSAHNQQIMARTTAAGAITTTALSVINGLSLQLAANALYRVEGWIVYSGTNAGVGFGILTSTVTFSVANGMLQGAMNALNTDTNLSTLNHYVGTFNSTTPGNSILLSMTNTAGAALPVKFEGMFGTLLAGSFDMAGRVSATGQTLTVMAGSYIRAWKIA
jgi:hypothetical protein